MKKNSIALLEDSYISPLLLNTLIREGVPAHAKSNRLKMELGRYYPDLIILNENEATNILTKPESLVYANSDLSLSTMMDSLNGPLEMDVIGSHKDKSDSKAPQYETSMDTNLRGSETERIHGEDLACDAYINVDGQPVVLGIYEHPVLDEDDFRDIVYYTSGEIMRSMLPRTNDALRRMSSFQWILGASHFMRSSGCKRTICC